jgi:hypothetical protein
MCKATVGQTCCSLIRGCPAEAQGRPTSRRPHHRSEPIRRLARAEGTWAAKADRGGTRSHVSARLISCAAAYRVSTARPTSLPSRRSSSAALASSSGRRVMGMAGAAPVRASSTSSRSSWRLRTLLPGSSPPWIGMSGNNPTMTSLPCFGRRSKPKAGCPRDRPRRAPAPAQRARSR